MNQTISGTREQLQAYHPDETLPMAFFRDEEFTWGGMRWKCAHVLVGDDNVSETIELKRLS